MSVEKESLSFELKHVEVSPHSDESDSLITKESNTVYTGDSDLLIDELGSVLSQDNKYMMSKLRSGGHPLLNMMCGFGVETHVLAHFLRLNITTQMLSSLNNQDLVHFGVFNAETRLLMLNEFKRFPSRECTSAASDGPSGAKVVLTNVFENLVGLRAALGMVLEQMYVNTNSEQVNIGERSYSALLVLGTLDQLDYEVSELERRLQKLQFSVSEEAPSKVAPQSSRSTLWLVVAGSAALIGFCAWQSWGDMRPFVVRPNAFMWLSV